MSHHAASQWKVPSSDRCRTMDIMMLALHKARERTLKQWQDLFARADDRFRLRRWARSQDSNMGSLEFVWQGKNAGNEAF